MKKTKLRKTSKKEYRISSVKKLKNTQAWKNLSLLVRTEEKGVCFTCGKINPINKCDTGHFIQAGGNCGTLFDRMNNHCQCKKCNLYLSGNLLIYNDKMIEKYGEQAVKELRLKANQYHPGYTRKELKEIAIKFKS